MSTELLDSSLIGSADAALEFITNILEASTQYSIIAKDWDGNSKDISDEIRLTEELKATQFYARSLIEASLDPLVTISPEGKITDVNDASVEVTGVPRERLIGTDFSDYFTELEKVRAEYRRVFSEGLQVIDTGIGIKVEDLPRLFRDFEQLESSTARHYEGSGLGLALTKKLVKPQKDTIRGYRPLGHSRGL